MAPGASGQPSLSQLTPYSSLSSQYPTSSPSTPRQHARDQSSTSRTPSPRFGAGQLSPRSVSSESSRAITSVRSVSQNCRYQWTKPALRRIPYSIGSEPLDSPASTPPQCLDEPLEKQLTKDILAMYKRLLPSRESQEKRKTIIGKLERILSDEFPGKDVEVSVFGSSGNLLLTSESDVDICIIISGLETVCTLADMLARRGMKKVQCVHAKAVPIVKIWDPELELACDLNVNNLVALKNTQMVKTYMQLDDRVRPLAMVIKYWSKRRKINEASGGTLSSYTWTLLIINFLQLRQPPILPVLSLKDSNGHPRDEFISEIESLKGYGKDNHDTLGDLLFQFFRRYGYQIDYDSAVLSVRLGKLMTKKEKRWHMATNNRLCVEEPFNTDRNLGNTADDTAFRGLHLEIRRAFSRLCEAQDLATSVCEQYNHPAGETRPLFEKSTPLPRPVLSRSASQSGRIARASHGNARASKARSDRNGATNRRASNPANFGLQAIPNVPGVRPAINGAGFLSPLQHPRAGIHDHLNRLSEQLTAQENHLRYQQLLVSQFQVQQALLSGQQRASQGLASGSQQRGPTNEFSSTHQLALNEGSNTLGLQLEKQYGPTRDSTQAHTGLQSLRSIDYPQSPSPSFVESHSFSRRSAKRSSTSTSAGHTIRSQSQPARAVPPHLVSLSHLPSPYSFYIGHGQNVDLSRQVQYPAIVDASGRSWSPYAPTSTVVENFRREYLGYSIGESSQQMNMKDAFYLPQIPSYEDLQRDKYSGRSSQTKSPAIPSSIRSEFPNSQDESTSLTDSLDDTLAHPYHQSHNDHTLSLPTHHAAQSEPTTSREEPLILNGSIEQQQRPVLPAGAVWQESQAIAPGTFAASIGHQAALFPKQVTKVSSLSSPHKDTSGHPETEDHESFSQSFVSNHGAVLDARVPSSPADTRFDKPAKYDVAVSDIRSQVHDHDQELNGSSQSMSSSNGPSRTNSRISLKSPTSLAYNIAPTKVDSISSGLSTQIGDKDTPQDSTGLDLLQNLAKESVSAIEPGLAARMSGIPQGWQKATARRKRNKVASGGEPSTGSASQPKDLLQERKGG